MADIDNKAQSSADDARTGMGNFKDEADERIAGLRDEEEDTS